MGEDAEKPRKTRDQAARRPIGLARRIIPTVSETDKQGSSLLVYYDKNGLLDYYTQSEYFKLLDIGKALFSLDCTSFDEDSTLEYNNNFVKEALPSL